jgi:class 3 adenylate cyclase
VPVTDIANPVISVPHGRIHFDISPDTNSLFCLWLQPEVNDNTIYELPKGERSANTSAADILHHPSFDRYFQSGGVRNILALSAELQTGLVVVLFTDVVGSTDMYAAQGDWGALELIKAHFNVLFAAFSRWGRVVKTIGDAVMAAFASPAAAIEAAAESLLEIERKCQQHEGVNFRIRIGIHCGSAVMVPLNSINDYFGQTVNTAARIEGCAEPSGCLMSQDILDFDTSALEAFEAIIASDDFEEIPQQVLNLKGIVGGTKVRGFKLAEKKKTAETAPESDETPPVMIKSNSFLRGMF